VKTNIGHLEAAAGIAGLIKATLCLQHRQIPPHLHFRNLNPNISLDNTRFAIPTEAKPWPAESSAHLAGVSSFGFGGTNAHVILQGAPAAPALPEKTEVRPYHLLVLSAKSASAVKQLASRFEEYLEKSPSAWADVCATAKTGRMQFRHRLALLSSSAAAAREQLAAWLAGQPAADVSVGHAVADRIRPAFLFTGQGSQYPGMGRQLYETEPAFRNALDRCTAILDPLLDRPLLDVIFAPASDQALNQTLYTQPALFAFEWALAELWTSWGIQPDYLIGHSLGELVAACVSGVFSLEDGLRLVAARGRLTQLMLCREAWQQFLRVRIKFEVYSRKSLSM
jgi:acyl transferase domain-containing protein